MRLHESIIEILEYIFPPDRKQHAVLHADTNALRKRLPRAADDTPAFIHAAFRYRAEPAETLLHLLKYKGDPRAVRACAHLLYEELIDMLAENILQRCWPDIFIPIPLSSERKRERGFNQSELLLDTMCEYDDANIITPHTNVLYKPHPTLSQTQMPNKKQRKENVRGCFSTTDSKKISGRNCVLIDDIVTTGATLTEARKTLHKAGADNVVGLAFAH
jgi:ComF family protein